MTREEAKRRSELYSALADGKIIQVLVSSGEWKDVEIDKLNCISENISFRIKPEPKYRPFKSQEECWQEMHNHSDFGWLTRIDTGNFERIKSVCQETIEFIVTNAYLYEDAFKYYKFSDGTPFGIKEN